MSDRRPTDDELLLEALEATRAGNGAAAAATARLAHDKALQAELEGLKAVSDLLKADAEWGAQSGTDAPPPHLLDAILRAEVAARPDAIRSAVAAASPVGGAPAAPAASWWSRFSSWILGGGALVGAAAAVMLTVTRAPADVAAPKTAEAPAQLAAAPATPPAVTTPPPDSAPPPPPADGVAATLGDGFVEGDGAIAAGATRRLREEKASLATAMPADAKTGKADKASTAGEDAPARDRSIGGLGANVGTVDLDDEASTRGALSGAAGLGRKDAAAPSGLAQAGPGAAGSSGGGMAPAEAEAPAAEPAAPMTTSPTSAPPAPQPAAPKPAPVRIISADEARKNFLEARAKAEAKQEAVAEAKGKAKAPAAAKKAAREEADAAREQMAREQRLQEANGVLVTAERELQFGRFSAALDLAQQAEAMAGSGLGLAPASTQARAYLGLKRFAAAARVASRLLPGSAASAQLVDGLIAGADAAVAIGDLRLAERLLTKAASTENPDAARRAVARQKLTAIAGKATAPAKAKASEPPAAAAADNE
jgi:hypothetical protein